jgi:catechol 2,3-dioxygenase-like lactoylglutathione lyase family enzyme
VDGISTIDHTGFVTENLVRAEKWYEKVFGAQVLFRTHLSTADRKKGYVPFTFVNMGGHRYELCLALDEYLPPNDSVDILPRIAFEVSDHEMDRAAAVCEANQIPFEGPVDRSDLPNVGRTLLLIDPDGNVTELCTRKADGAPVPEGDDEGAIRIGRISHVVLEATDLDVTERFYDRGMGLDPLGRTAANGGPSRTTLRTSSGQMFQFAKVDALSPRSLFRAGADTSPVPDPVPGTPYRYKGAHTAVAVSSPEAYQRVFKGITEYGGFDEGDHRAALRGPGEQSTYFYDPSGNRLQLIIVADQH